MTDYGKVAVLMGGPSTEREVSLNSGAAVLQGLLNKGVDAHGVDAGADVLDVLREGGFDRAFTILHGRWGEDGVIQGGMELIGMPYTGSGVQGSALGMDKLRCKQLWQGVGLPTPDFIRLTAGADIDAVIDQLGLPLVIKPSREGSSIGISMVRDRAGMQQAMDDAFACDPAVIAEKYITGVELTASILGGETLPLIRLETPREFYDYDAKYVLDDTTYVCPCGLPEEMESDIQAMAMHAFEIVGCSGWGRVDVMLDEGNQPWLLEVNTAPGMTDHSLVPMAARQAGYSFDDLVVRILETSNEPK
ncbi:MAG: D-alanine--D-alanine ligase [Gammaproteobacteria bacterium]|nr:MAG: D-alanine--D-alanine ligase [Gammaproteobacteria bacterium]RTZ61310.1 MAG: D-alanine--D-alanine ligase [Gammaproteobacteria bacterium]